MGEVLERLQRKYGLRPKKGGNILDRLEAEQKENWARIKKLQEKLGISSVNLTDEQVGECYDEACRIALEARLDGRTLRTEKEEKKIEGAKDKFTKKLK